MAYSTDTNDTLPSSTFTIGTESVSMFDTPHDTHYQKVINADGSYTLYPTASGNLRMGTRETEYVPPTSLAIHRAKIGFVVAPVGWPNLSHHDGMPLELRLQEVAVFADLDAAQSYITLTLTGFNEEK